MPFLPVPSHPPECREQATARLGSGESWGRLAWQGLVPVSSPGPGPSLGYSQSGFVPWEPPEHLACLILLGHSLAVIPTEDIFRGQAGRQACGRDQTSPLSRELRSSRGSSARGVTIRALGQGPRQVCLGSSDAVAGPGWEAQSRHRTGPGSPATSCLLMGKLLNFSELSVSSSTKCG